MSAAITPEGKTRRLPRLRRAGASLREGARAHRRRKLILRLLLVVPAAVITVFAFTFVCFYVSYAGVVDERLAAGYLTSRAGLYAAPRVLREGQNLSRERLVESLRRAGYVDTEASDVWSGRFAVEDGAVRILPRRGEGLTASEFGEVRVEFDRRGRVSSLSADGAPLEFFALEPEPLTHDAGVKTGQRETLAYADLPPHVVRAVLAAEDRRFFEHYGVDARGVARAAWSWVSGAAQGPDDARRQGGSTITQQLVKNTYLTPERTLRRKFHEAVLASVLERKLTKQDILALYCNEIYLGQRGTAAVRGVARAARVYFGKEPKDLSLAEAALIAGMIQSPARYAPDRHPERARGRRDVVLRAMLEENFVTREEFEAAAREPVSVAPLERAEGSALAPYFIDYVNRVVESEHEGEDSTPARVHTTIDPELQRLAEQAVNKQLERLDKVFKGRKRPQAALVALDPRSGHVLAMVGGRDYAESQLNRATDAQRQPGSVFKPIVYAAALEQGVSPVTMFADAPREFRYDLGGRASYRPANYGGGYSMRDVTMRDALVRSLNVVTVDVAMRAGLSRVSDMASKFGLPRPEAYPALALGTTEATPLQVAAAYAALANGGSRTRPVVVARSDGHVDAAPVRTADTPQQIVKPSTSYVVTDMLSAVITEGTARAARGEFKGMAVAGKTGTSRDGWFAGYTPNLVCVVWVGFDDNSELGLSGAESALPAWAEFVKGAVALRPELGGAAFARPAGVTFVEVDPETGLLASASCPHRERVATTAAAAPDFECYTHGEPYTLPALAVADSQLAGSNSLALTAHTASTYEPYPAAHVRPSVSPRRVPSSLTEEPEPAAAPVYTRATQVEIMRDGRRRLTNAPRTITPSSFDQ
ncbi:MAG TPA: PBP1A family penicillin-binding protein [Pyrinomonadaceae bacterium]|nr:PBP1A family penicillin-binding protein [Pyrinomonadaceae bacterium]